MSLYQQLEEAVNRLEAAMRAGDMWRQDAPSAAALASRTPFCADTLSLPQWLRFVLVARLRALIAQRQPLPGKAQIAPAAEVYLKQYSSGRRVPVMEALRDIDRLLDSVEQPPH